MKYVVILLNCRAAYVEYKIAFWSQLFLRAAATVARYATWFQNRFSHFGAKTLQLNTT
jgi:hypothetical protein